MLIFSPTHLLFPSLHHQLKSGAISTNITTSLLFGKLNVPFIPALFSRPCCLYLRVAALLHLRHVVLTWLHLSLMAAEHSSEKSGRIFSHVLSNDIKNSWEGGGEVTLLDGCPPDGLKTFRGRTEGYCTPLRNTDDLAPPPATLVVAIKEKKKSISSEGRGSLPRLNSPKPPPRQTAITEIRLTWRHGACD